VERYNTKPTRQQGNKEKREKEKGCTMGHEDTRISYIQKAKGQNGEKKRKGRKKVVKNAISCHSFVLVFAGPNKRMHGFKS
jgi:hypothetical protein